MSVGIKTIEFEKRQAHLASELDDGPPYTVHGIALGANDITRGASGIKKIWPEEELRAAAETLRGRNLVEDHNNESRGVVGEVTKAGYKEGVGVLYEAELFDAELAEKIANGLLEVSVRGYHKDVDEMEETDDGAKIVEAIEFDNLSIVANGASPSNTLEMGPAEELSVAALSEFVGELQEDEEDGAEIEPGMWVQWSSGKGITISIPEGGEVEVDVYEEKGGKWRSTGNTKNMSTDTLSEWDVDEEEEIGAREEDSSDEEDEEENASTDDSDKDELAPPEDFMFGSREEAEAFIEGEDDLTGVHEMDGEWMPGADHEEFSEWHDEKHSDEMGDRVEGEEEKFSTDHDRKEGSDESRNPDGAFDDEYEEAESGDDPEETEETLSDEGSDDESDVEELQEWEFHEPTWNGTTESDWSSPDMEDFDTDDLGEIAPHFLISQTGFPPENFTDLALPVVEPNGSLNVNALSAVKGGRGVSAVKGLSQSMEKKIVDWVNETANSTFDKSWGKDEEENAKHGMDPDVEDDRESEQMDPIDSSLDLINVFLRENGRDERDSVDKMVGWLFSSTDVATKKIDAFRTAANAFLDQQGGVDSFDAVDVESFRDWLLTNGSQTDDGVNARAGPTSGHVVPSIATPVHVLSGDDLRSFTSVRASKKDNSNNEDKIMTNIEEELEELDEPVAVEKTDLEELQEKADRMDEMSETLSDLKERTDVLDSVDREQVDELAESDEPVVLDKSEYEALSAEAEQVKKVYADALSGEGPFSAEDLADKFSIEELREKYEEAGHELEEELSAEPRSGDPSEEELEEKAEEENKSEEELEQAEQIKSEQERLRSMITGDD